MSTLPETFSLVSEDAGDVSIDQVLELVESRLMPKIDQRIETLMKDGDPVSPAKSTARSTMADNKSEAGSMIDERLDSIDTDVKAQFSKLTEKISKVESQAKELDEDLGGMNDDLERLK